MAAVIAGAASLVGTTPSAEARPCDFYQDPVSCLYPPDPQPIPPVPTPPCDPVSTCVSDPRLTASSQLIETMAVRANDPNGTASQQPILGGRTYTLVASGTFIEGGTGAIADPECSLTTSDANWQPYRFGTAPDLLDLTVNGASLTWLPADTSSPCDEGTHVYTATLKPPAATFVRAAVADTSHADNKGALKLSIIATGAATDIGPNGVAHVPNPGVVVPGNRVVDVIEVDSRNPSGAFTSIPLAVGQTYVWRVEGSYVYEPGGARADGECSQPLGDPRGSFARDRYPNSVLEMLINDFDPPWAPATTNNAGCDPSHRYEWTTQPAVDGHVLFRINELGVPGYRDNVGILTVTVSVRVNPN
ncbi:MAG TPA: hypothetical protein VMY34_06385 [Acidimicrobiales bacterium]|nr:hypothetical protein [Acidimicrobiales bacterium]